MPSATLSRWPVVIARPVGADDVDDDGRLTDVACERIDAPSTQGGGTVAMRGVHQRVSGDAPGAGFSDVRDPEAPGGSP